MNTKVDGSPYVLFVDDEEMTRKTFQRIASQEFPVLLASNVAEAIEQLKEHGDEIGVLLTDQRMPGGLGVELLEHARDEHPGVVRMLTTAYSELEDAIAAVNRGEIIRYIEKPWNNIDALLIDLRVAMRFHLLERSNQELMAEKMSAKSRGARLDRLQVLTALAAAEPNSAKALVGLEAALRCLSELRGSNETGTGTDAKEMYSGPVDAANFAIKLADRCSRPLTELEAATWSESSTIELGGEAVKQEFPSALAGNGAEFLSRAIALFSQEGESSVVGSLDGSGEQISLSLQQKGEGNNLLSRWLNIGSDEESVQAIADLLKLYFIGYTSGAEIEIDFDEAGHLVGMRANFSPDQTMREQDSDWLEDMLILLA